MQCRDDEYEDEEFPTSVSLALLRGVGCGEEGGLCKPWNFDSGAVEWTGEMKYAAAGSGGSGGGGDGGWQLYLPQQPVVSSRLMSITRATSPSWGHCAGSH